MDFLDGIVGWLPVLLGLLSWIAVRSRDSRWGRLLAGKFGLKQREHETASEFHWRRGSVWLTTAVAFGLLAYIIGQRWAQRGAGAPNLELIAAVVSAALCVWAAANSARAFWASKRASSSGSA